MRFAMWGKTEQRKTSGAQLFDVTNVDMKTILNVDGTTNANGSIHTSGFIKVSPNTTYSVSKTRQNRGKFYNLEKKPLTTDKFDFELSNNGDKFTTSESVEYVRFSIYETVDLNTLMMNQGDTLKPYEPYSGGFPSPSPDYSQPIEITDQPVTVTIKGGTEQQSITLMPPKPMTKWDKLEKVDGVWCWRYQTKKYTVTGEEVFAKGGDSYVQGSSTSFYTSKDIGDPVSADSSLMNRLTKNERVWSKPGEIGYTLNVNQLHMRFLNTTLGVSDDATEVEKKTAYANYLKAEYAKGTPYELLYAVKESKLIPLSPSEQDKLNALTMYAGTTEVTNTGGCNMELTYTVDTKSYVDNKIAAISAAVLEV